MPRHKFELRKEDLVHYLGYTIQEHIDGMAKSDGMDRHMAGGGGGGMGPVGRLDKIGTIDEAGSDDENGQCGIKLDPRVRSSSAPSASYHAPLYHAPLGGNGGS